MNSIAKLSNLCNTLEAEQSYEIGISNFKEVQDAIKDVLNDLRQSNIDKLNAEDKVSHRNMQIKDKRELVNTLQITNARQSMQIKDLKKKDDCLNVIAGILDNDTLSDEQKVNLASKSIQITFTN